MIELTNIGYKKKELHGEIIVAKNYGVESSIRIEAIGKTTNGRMSLDNVEGNYSDVNVNITKSKKSMYCRDVAVDCEGVEVNRVFLNKRLNVVTDILKLVDVSVQCDCSNLVSIVTSVTSSCEVSDVNDLVSVVSSGVSKSVIASVVSDDSNMSKLSKRSVKSVVSGIFKRKEKVT